MRRILLASIFTLATAPAFAAAGYSDAAQLVQDTTFVGRVTMSMLAQCVAMQTNVNRTPALLAYCQQATNTPTIYGTLFTNVVAVNSTVLADATVNGTTPLTAGNRAAQAALVTDAHIDAAVSSGVGTLLPIIGH